MGVLVTVGLCVKNCEQTIDEALDSIISQDYPHQLIEVIIVDNGCTDRTIPKIMRKLSSSDIKFKILKEYGGLGAARQKAVNYANGKYIIWIDGDITIPRDHIRKQVKIMESHPHISKARAKQGWLWSDADNFLTKCGLFAYINEIKTGKQPKIAGIGGSICRINAIKDVGGFDINIRGAGEDTDLTIRMIRCGWGVMINNTVFYHKHEASWKTLWNRFVWYGYGEHYISHKHNLKLIRITRLPFVSLFLSIKKASEAFKFTGKKEAFLLPLPYIFGSIAWWIGFIKAHLENYQPKG